MFPLCVYHTSKLCELLQVLGTKSTSLYVTELASKYPRIFSVFHWFYRLGEVELLWNVWSHLLLKLRHSRPIFSVILCSIDGFMPSPTFPFMYMNIVEYYWIIFTFFFRFLNFFRFNLTTAFNKKIYNRQVWWSR